VELWSPTGRCNRWLRDTAISRGYPQTDNVNGTILTCGGGSSTSTSTTSAGRTCYKLNPSTEQWSYHSRLNRPRYYHSSVVTNGTLYTFGGAGSSSNYMTSEYLPAGSTTWSNGVSLPSRHDYGCVVAVSSDTLFTLGRFRKPRLYNLATGSWTNLPTTLRNRLDQACAYVNTGGLNGVIVAGGDGSSRTSEFYDLGTGGWTMAGNLNIARGNAAEIKKLGNRYFIIGGGPASVEEFLPASKTWATAGLPPLKLGRSYAPGVAAVSSFMFSNCNEATG